jgi:hypothetical protein
MPDSKLKSNFAISYLQNKHTRSYFGMNLSNLCHFCVSIPDGSL